jgi:hypothetical protein
LKTPPEGRHRKANWSDPISSISQIAFNHRFAMIDSSHNRVAALRRLGIYCSSA